MHEALASILVGAAVLVMAWGTISTRPPHGALQAQLHRGDSATPFAFRVTSSRGGIDGWLNGAHGSRLLEAFDAERARTSVVMGNSLSVRVKIGGARIIKKKNS